jgi:integrase
MKLTELYEKIQTRQMPYKVEPELLQLRDKALISLLVESGLRVSEARKIRKKQFNFSDANFIMIKDVETSKHGTTREEIPLPTKGALLPFTEIIREWLTNIPEKENFVIPSASGIPIGENIHWNKSLSRQRIHVIIKTITGKYPHYLRAMCETHYGRIFRTNWALKDFMGLTDLRSTEPYVKTDWRDYAQRILE